TTSRSWRLALERPVGDGLRGGAAHDAIVDHGAPLVRVAARRIRHAHRVVIVGELQVHALARVERRSSMRKNAFAVDPRIEEAILPRRPTDVIDEVVPDVLLDLPKHRVEAAIAGVDAAIADETQQSWLRGVGLRFERDME